MNNFMTVVLVLLLLFGLAAFFNLSKPVKIKHNKCKKDPSKMCPYIVQWNSNGGMSASGHIQCCKVKDQFKALNKLIVLSDKHDGHVGEFHFPKHMREEAKQQEKFWNDFDSSGPTE